MRLLAVETATEACSAALWVEGEVHERYAVAPRGHGAMLLDMLEGLLAEAGLSPAGLDAVAFGRGPGAFTGVRVAAGVTQGIAFAADLPVVAVSSLAALAQGACEELAVSGVLAAIDARMGEVYWGVYRADPEGVVVLQGDECVAPPEDVPTPTQLPQGEWVGVGTGWGTYGETLSARVPGESVAVRAERYPRARDVAGLGALAYRRGQTVPPDQALPVYLRNDVAARPETG